MGQIPKITNLEWQLWEQGRNEQTGKRLVLLKKSREESLLHYPSSLKPGPNAGISQAYSEKAES